MGEMSYGRWVKCPYRVNHEREAKTERGGGGEYSAGDGERYKMWETNV